MYKKLLNPIILILALIVFLQAGSFSALTVQAEWTEEMIQEEETIRQEEAPEDPVLSEDIISEEPETILVEEIDFPYPREQYGTLRCERIGFSVPVFWDDTDEILDWGAGTSLAGYMPGLGKVIILSGDTLTHFRPLEYMEVGDMLSFETTYGNYEYKITSIEVYNENDLLDLLIEKTGYEEPAEESDAMSDEMSDELSPVEPTEESLEKLTEKTTEETTGETEAVSEEIDDSQETDSMEEGEVKDAETLIAELYQNKVVKYLLVPEDVEIPVGLDKEMIVISIPVESVYTDSLQAKELLEDMELEDLIAVENEESAKKPEYKNLILEECDLAILSDDFLEEEQKERTIV